MSVSNFDAITALEDVKEEVLNLREQVADLKRQIKEKDVVIKKNHEIITALRTPSSANWANGTNISSNKGEDPWANGNNPWTSGKTNAIAKNEDAKCWWTQHDPVDISYRLADEEYPIFKWTACFCCNVTKSPCHLMWVRRSYGCKKWHVGCLPPIDILANFKEG